MSDSKIQCISLRGEKSVNYQYARLLSYLKSRHPARYLLVLSTLPIGRVSFCGEKTNKSSVRKWINIIIESLHTRKHCQISKNMLYAFSRGKVDSGHRVEDTEWILQRDSRGGYCSPNFYTKSQAVALITPKIPQPLTSAAQLQPGNQASAVLISWLTGNLRNVQDCYTVTIKPQMK